MSPNPNHPPKSETPPDVMLGTYSASGTVREMVQSHAASKSPEPLYNYVIGQLAVVKELKATYPEEDVDRFLLRAFDELKAILNERQ